MLIFIDSNGQYPRFIGDILIEHKNWKEGDAIPAGWTLVQETAPPQVSEDQMFYEGPPTVIDGVVSQVWFVRDLTEEELYVKNAPKLIRQRMLDAGFTEEEIRIVARNQF